MIKHVAGNEKGLLIYGGSFNPVHIGHLRLAIEARAAMSHFVDKIEFVPTAMHPQKQEKTLLPFSFRVELINLAITNLPYIICNRLESCRNGPSYTYDTLAVYAEAHDASKLFFLLGSQDFQLLRSWHRGLEIIDNCNLVIAPRGEFSFSRFKEVVADFWSEATSDKKAEKYLPPACHCIKLHDKTRLFYLPIPWLDISASRIRELWLDGQNIDFLMPQASLDFLNQNKSIAETSWLETCCQC